MGWGLWGAWELWGPQGLLPGPLSPPPGWLADRAHSSAWAHSHISGAGTWLVARGWRVSHAHRIHRASRSVRLLTLQKTAVKNSMTSTSL